MGSVAVASRGTMTGVFGRGLRLCVRGALDLLVDGGLLLDVAGGGMDFFSPWRFSQTEG